MSPAVRSGGEEDGMVKGRGGGGGGGGGKVVVVVVVVELTEDRRAIENGRAERL